jgi:phosphatidylglycerol:prolipoprotein diacylglycerol transferase
MFPTIIQIGPLALHSYGLMLALAFLAAICLLQHRAASRGIPRDTVMDFGLVIMAASVIGSRAFYVLTHWGDYAARPLSSLAVWEGGLTFYGGVLLAVPAGIIFLKRKKVPFWTSADLAAPAFALGLGIGRLGCFLNGCCFGNPSDLPWAVRFPTQSAAGAAFACPVHPTQLYESAFGFMAMFLILSLEKKKHHDGTLFCLFIGLYGLWRLASDSLRHYESSQVWLWGLTNNQWISILLMVGALGASVWLAKRAKTNKG